LTLIPAEDSLRPVFSSTVKLGEAQILKLIMLVLVNCLGKLNQTGREKNVTDSSLDSLQIDENRCQRTVQKLNLCRLQPVEEL
jgi:hypothetical protein